MTGRSLHQDPLPLISLQDTTEHAKRRKAWGRAFSSTALKEYQPTVAKRVAQLVDALQSQGGQVDLAQWIGYLTYAISLHLQLNLNALCFLGMTLWAIWRKKSIPEFFGYILTQPQLRRRNRDAS